jgi:hypothetical protein
MSARNFYGISDDNIVFLQSGRQTVRKKLLDSIYAFSSCKDSRAILLIAGTIESSIEDDVLRLILKDPRINYLGWQSFDNLTNLLCASDVYLQPGTQSVTMQHSLCCRCAVILDDTPSHYFYVKKNGWLIGRDGSLYDIIYRSLHSDLEKMKTASYEFARKNIDYKILSRRVFI